jgi:predicted GNAT family acetyltransferase
MDYSLVFGAN